MPLIMARRGDIKRITAVRGRPEIKRYLESMGFVEGAVITIISEIDGNLIVNVKDARVALSKSMASRIFV